MTFAGPLALSTWAIVAVSAAALTMLAYLLRMRRRRFEVPFARLWQKVIKEHEANALWKQLKRWVSLFVALVIVGLLLFSILDPKLGGEDPDAKNVVILVDASASMQTRDGDDNDRSRFERAKVEAVELLQRMGAADRALLMRMTTDAAPVWRFTNDHDMLAKRASEMVVTDAPANLPRSLAAATAALQGRRNPMIVIISDGAFAPSVLANLASDAPATPLNKSQPIDDNSIQGTRVDLAGIDVSYVSVGRDNQNVGITAFSARRYIGNQNAFEVYAEVRNFGTVVQQRRLTVYSDTSAIDTQTLILQPGQTLRQIYKELPADASGKLTATLSDGTDDSAATATATAPAQPQMSDNFPIDDIAYASLTEAKKQRILLVADDNLFLDGAVLSYDNGSTDKVTPSEYAADPSIAASYSTVIFDDFTPAIMPPPPTNLIYFHPNQAGSPFRIVGNLGRPSITDTLSSHPVMRWIEMSDVNFDSSLVFAADASLGEVALATSVRSPVVVAKRDRGRKLVGFGFSLPMPGRADVTDLPLRVAFPLLLANSLDWFSGVATDLGNGTSTGTRHTLSIDGAAAARLAKISEPDGNTYTAPIEDGVLAFEPQRVGHYTIEAIAESDNQVMARMTVAVNLENLTESSIAPTTKLVIAGKTLGQPAGFAISRSQTIWIYLLVGAIVILMLEWFTYQRRITV